MVCSGARVQKMAIRRVCVTASPALATPLHPRSTSGEDVAYLASVAYCPSASQKTITEAGCE